MSITELVHFFNNAIKFIFFFGKKNTHTLKTERSNIGMCFTVIIIFHSGLEFIKESADLQKKTQYSLFTFLGIL